MRTLVLITSQFPFGNGESFLETELRYLSKEFKRIFIISQNTTHEISKSIPAEVRVFRHNPSTTLTGFFFLPFLVITQIKEILRLLKLESDFRERSGFQFKLRQERFLLKKIIKALQLKNFIIRILANERVSKDIIFYSYWFNTGAYAICLLSFPGSIRIARAHGSDLYEEKSPKGYLPMMHLLAESLDCLFFVSENGREYFINRIKADPSKCVTSRLGLIAVPHREAKKVDNGMFNVVSCSNLIPLKRVDLIVKAIGLLYTEKIVNWIHFGSGPMFTYLASIADEELGDRYNIRYRFAGQVSNEEILKYYDTFKPDLFINVSSTEGAPVSIMEAQLFGIPVIATSVGGVGEMVNEKTGILLKPDITPSDLAMAIQTIIELPAERISEMKTASILWREKCYDAAKNYTGFIKKVNSILAALENDKITGNEN